MKPNINKEEFTKKIDELAKTWDVSGGYAVYYQDEELHKNLYGFADREKKVPITVESTYAFSIYSSTLLAISIMKLAEEKKLKLSDLLNKFVPEYRHADKITIRNILRKSSGIPDFFYGKIMVDLAQNEEHKKLSEAERVFLEKRMLPENQSIKRVLELIGNENLDFIPGTDINYSESNNVFLGAVIERVTGMDLFAYEKKAIFDPLGIKVSEGKPANTVSYAVYRQKELMRLSQEVNCTSYFTSTFDEILKLMIACTKGELLSIDSWKKVLTLDKEDMGIGFINSNGIFYGSLGFMAWEFGFYFDPKTTLCYGHITNQGVIFKNNGSVYHYFKRDAREEIEALFTYPQNTKIVRVNKQNLWNALEIQVNPKQLEFVLEAKSSIAMCLAYKTRQAFVEMEGKRAIGLLVLDVDKKKEHFEILIVQIDKRYQHRGYGKIMLEWAVQYLKEQGAKKLEIGVNRFNIPAQRLYLSIGFTPKSVYDQGILMQMVL